jgi:hypothetical protein
MGQHINPVLVLIPIHFALLYHEGNKTFLHVTSISYLSPITGPTNESNKGDP